MSDSDIVMEWQDELDDISDTVFEEEEKPSKKSDKTPMERKEVKDDNTSKRKKVSFEDIENQSKRSRSSSLEQVDTTARQSRSMHKRATSPEKHKNTKGGTNQEENSSSRQNNRYRSNSRQRLNSKHRSESRQRSGSRQRSDSRQRSYSRQRSNSRQRANSGHRATGQRSSREYQPNNSTKSHYTTNEHQNNENRADWDCLALEKINFENEEHIAFVDFPLNQQQILKAKNKHGGIIFEECHKDTITQIANKVIDCINTQKHADKRTYISATIFNKNFEQTGTDGVIAIAKKISGYVPMDKHGASKIRLAFGTITYAPAIQHRWPEIQEANFFLKQLTHTLGCAPLNTHKWTTKPHIFNTRRTEVMGKCFTEYVNKQNLGRSLNMFGAEKVTKGIVMHHCSGVREITGQHFNMEQAPVNLNISAGHKLPDVDSSDKELVAKKRWLYRHMGEMEGKVRLANNIQRDHDAFRQKVRLAIEDVLQEQLNRQGLFDNEKADETHNPKEDSPNLKNYEAIISDLQKQVTKLENLRAKHESDRSELEEVYLEDAQRFDKCIKENANLRVQLNEKEEEAEKLGKKVKKYKQENADLRKQLKDKEEEEQPASNSKDKAKIERLENKVLKLQKDLREEQDEFELEREEYREEIKTLKDQVKRIKRSLEIVENINDALEKQLK